MSHTSFFRYFLNAYVLVGLEEIAYIPCTLPLRLVKIFSFPVVELLL